MLKRSLLWTVLCAPLACNLNPKGELPSAGGAGEEFPEPELTPEEAAVDPGGAEPDPDRGNPDGIAMPSGPEDAVSEPEFVDTPPDDGEVDDDSASEPGPALAVDDAGIPDLASNEAGAPPEDAGSTADAASSAVTDGGARNWDGGDVDAGADAAP